MNDSDPVTTAKPSLLYRLYRLLGTIALVGIVVYLVHTIYAGRAAFRELEFGWNLPSLVFAVIVAVLAYQALFVAWLLMLRRAGYYRGVFVSHYARIWWTSYMYRYLPGKVLLVVERARLGTRLGIPVAPGAAMPVMETLLAVLAGGTVALLAVAYYASDDTGTLAAIGFLAIIVMFLLPAAYRWLCKRPFVQRRYPELESVAFDHRDLLIFVIPFVLHYLLLGLSFFLLARTVYPLTLSDLPGFCGMYALSHIMGILAVFAPGGIGIRDGALAVQLERLVPGAVAGAMALAGRAFFTAIELLSFAVVSLVCPRIHDPSPGDANRTRPPQL